MIKLKNVSRVPIKAKGLFLCRKISLELHRPTGIAKMVKISKDNIKWNIPEQYAFLYYAVIV